MKSISLFSGAMGLDLGLEQAGIETALCVEIDDMCIDTIKLNRPTLPVIHKSVEEVTKEDIYEASGLKAGEIDLVVGGPPCQSFSVFGMRKGLQDPRGQLIFEFWRLIDELKPQAFIMENVRGLLSTPIINKKDFDPEYMDESHIKKGSLIKLLLEKFNSIGYNVDCFVVNSVNYGAPQIRERVILIGNRLGYSTDFANPKYSNRPEDKLPPFKTLGDVIGKNFKDPIPEVMNFSPRKLKYLSMIPAGGNWRSLPEEIQKESMGKSWYLKGGRSAYWRKLSFEFPSPTVVTMPNHAGTSMCHPTELRAISVGEASAIQEFPRTWKFSGSTSNQFKQIGNAVPVRLGKIAGEAILKMLAKKEHRNSKDSFTIQHIRPHVRTRTYFKDGEAFAGNHCYYQDKKNSAAGKSQQNLFKEDELVEA